MLTKETIQQFVYQSLIINEHKKVDAEQFRATIREMLAETNAKADKLCAEVPYDEMCNMFIEQLKELQAARIPGIGKLALAKKAAAEDPEHFQAVYDAMLQQDLIDLQ